MKIDTVSRKSWSGTTLAAFMFEGGRSPLGVPVADGKRFVELAAEEAFTGQPGRTFLARAEQGGVRLMLCGLGKKKGLKPERVRVAAAKALGKAGEIGLGSVSFLVPTRADSLLEPGGFATAVVEGAVLSAYRFDKYRRPKEDDPKPVGGITLVFSDPKSITAGNRRAVDEASALVHAVIFTRDLVNEPPSPKPPEKMAESAAGLAKKGRIKVEVLHKEDLEKLGMGGILAVGAGSHQPPCMVHLTYTPSAKSRKMVAIIGKGITFDSGGLSLKPAQGMEAMKDDMAGAAAVLGLFKWLGSVEVPVTVHGLTPFAENMPGGGAQKPGDVIRHYNGKTAEVVSTDAEGRHLLADALAYASKLKPDVMIDIATLTGACVVALGDEYSALLGTDQRTINKLIALGDGLGEYYWQLPLPDRYKSHLKSRVADLKHTGRPGIAGTITAGLFLKEFVEPGVPWVHIDIAGPSFTKEDRDYIPAGGTGVTVRTLAAFIKSL